jgi:hypothetical protein
MLVIGMSGAIPRSLSGTRIIFTDTEKSNWSWDPVAGAYYWHRFFSHQPDLNFANPRVIAAITQVMRRWLDFGVDGSGSMRSPTCASAKAPTTKTCPRPRGDKATAGGG